MYFARSSGLRVWRLYSRLLVIIKTWTDTTPTLVLVLERGGWRLAVLFSVTRIYYYYYLVPMT